MRRPVTVYSTEFCGYCRAAKRFLESKGIPYAEIDLTADPAERDRISQLAQMYTVPMIFIGDECIAGYMELVGLARSGKLQGMIDGAD